MLDSFAVRGTLATGRRTFAIASLTRLGERFDLTRLPFSLKILLENLLRLEDGVNVTTREIKALANWSAAEPAPTEIAFMPSRVLLQDFTGVPCLVDLAAMREAMRRLGGDPEQINPLLPVELVIDHSIQVDAYGTKESRAQNEVFEFKRNHERYAFLRWGQKALRNLRVVPPATGIVHQVNLEYLARVVETREMAGERWALPDTLFGTDSHTTMVNALGVLGWGVGGIEAEAAMLGQPSSMLIPQVVGLRLTGTLPAGVTATDLTLTVTEMLRKHGVVGKFVEFFGASAAALPLATRATLANMAPEYGATCALFPIDAETINYLRLSGRDAAHLELVEAYCKAQGLWHEPTTPAPEYSSLLELDLAKVRPSMAGPRRPQDRLDLSAVAATLHNSLVARGDESLLARQTAAFVNEGGHESVVCAKLKEHNKSDHPRQETTLKHGAVVIAAITSCTNTSNPAVMLGAGLLARKALARGLCVKPWVKTSLAPGSRVVTDYLMQSGLLDALERLGFGVVGYGCTTCIGNSGPLPQWVSSEIADKNLTVAAVLSGNRNFEGRIHAEVKLNYLASPLLVVAYALAGTVDIDLTQVPLGKDGSGESVYLKDIWPSDAEIEAVAASAIQSSMFTRNYANVFEGDKAWHTIDTPDGSLYAWDAKSSYIKLPPYFDNMSLQLPVVANITGARCLALLGNSITTDHISPAGAIKPNSPAGRYLKERGVSESDFNTYGARRGHDEVMVRGTFANIRIRNRIIEGVEGGYTRHFPSGAELSIYDAAMRYKAEKTPLIVIAGKEYGTGSSRDWAAKGTLLLGVKAVLAESFERIHRSNLIGMGVLPLQFLSHESAITLGLTGHEVFTISGMENLASGYLRVVAVTPAGVTIPFKVQVALQTPGERAIYQHGGILQQTLRQAVNGVNRLV